MRNFCRALNHNPEFSFAASQLGAWCSDYSRLPSGKLERCKAPQGRSIRQRYTSFSEFGFAVTLLDVKKAVI
jgi:hypothetical protein